MLVFSSEIIHIAKLIQEISAENHANITKRERSAFKNVKNYFIN